MESLITLFAKPVQRRTLAAASLGWMLDATDVMIFSILLTELMRVFDMSTGHAGLLNSAMLVAAAIGGIAMGPLADRFGRVHALTASILIYTAFTVACGFAGSLTQLAVFRVGLGLGMGGEWAAGAALVAETWPAAHRGKVLGIVQSFWAVGYALAAVLVAVLVPAFGWRSVFFAGAVPALVAAWIRWKVPEPELWVNAVRMEGTLALLWRPPYRARLILVTLMNASTLFAWWGLFTWIPSYLALSPEQGGLGLGIVKGAGWLIPIQAGAWLGYVSFGALADRWGRKKMYVSFLVASAVFTLVFSQVRDTRALLVLGPVLGFVGSGYYSGLGAIISELFPTIVRATALGVGYNAGRVLGAAAPFVCGALAARAGFGISFIVVAAAFLAAAILALFVPETQGLELEA